MSAASSRLFGWPVGISIAVHAVAIVTAKPASESSGATPSRMTPSPAIRRSGTGRRWAGGRSTRPGRSCPRTRTASGSSSAGSGAFRDRPYAGTIAFGPSAGVSGQLGLVGPVGLEGHLRVTPFPVPVTDARLAVALRGGAFALTMGWRGIDVAGDELDAPQLRVAGPEIGVSLVF